jgi:uncharacterized damage-inducible protein DinB
MRSPRCPSSVAFLILIALASGAALRAEPAFEAAFRESLLRSFDEASGKIVRLAEAIPAERYGWRPMEGVSSVREVLVHVTATNYALGERLGTKAPLDRKGLDAAMKGKDEALAATRAGIAFIRGVLVALPAASLTEEVTVFGYKAPRLRVAFLPADHAHEHLGQLIAYARMNQVVPPWSK